MPRFSDLIRRASEHAYVFMRKSDDWGRMFSYVEMIAKIFPKISDYDLLRRSAQDMYASVKVIASSSEITWNTFADIIYPCSFH